MTDYLNTVLLPCTDFPLKPKPSAAVAEEALLARWVDTGLHAERMERNKNLPPFVLHDGPPYANGALHMGHALNKVLKDAVNRAAWMSGRSVDYVPGWDCHGLPVEWRVEEERRKSGQPPLGTLEFRDACRQSAAHWLGHQKAEFMRLGVDGDWDNPYSTMDYSSEAALAAELLSFRDMGLLRRSLRPVSWSPAERTALADSEVEYKDAESPTVHVLFRVESGPEYLHDVMMVAWTTTPWTLPANQAVAYGEELSYSVVEVQMPGEACTLSQGSRLLVASSRLYETMSAGDVKAWREVHTLTGYELQGMMLHHPLARFHSDYAKSVPMLPASFVTDEAGTGLVHVAPAHGEDDFRLGVGHGLSPLSTVDERGRMVTAGFEGMTSNSVHTAMADALRGAGTLFATGRVTHQVAFSQRSGARLLTRATPQWFVALDDDHNLRQNSLDALEDVKFHPELQRNRLTSMLQNRPDWCVSRQRTWGVPLPLFVNSAGEPLMDAQVDRRVLEAFAAEGADAWYADGADERFLGGLYDTQDWEMVKDVADVWFESGSTHAFVLRDRGMQRPADVYLEGSDQHRGWFQSSLLTAVATTGSAPYKNLVTHGFVLDDKSHKMSKSKGNVSSPADVVKEYGADVLRLWALSADSSEDLRVGPAVLKGVSENYRRLRNTLRFLLGNLHEWNPGHAVPFPELPRMERWVLACVADLDARLQTVLEDHRWHVFVGSLLRFCTVDLSAFWFECCKDTLYCDAQASHARRSVVTVLHHLHGWLSTALAPVLPFLAEEAWLARWGMDSGSVHMEHFMSVPCEWTDADLVQRMLEARELRADGLLVLEHARGAKTLASGSSCDASVSLADPGMLLSDNEWMRALQPGSFVRLQGGAALASPATGNKCVRCRRTCDEVGASAAHPSLCLRCEEVAVSFVQAA